MKNIAYNTKKGIQMLTEKKNSGLNMCHQPISQSIPDI